MVKKKQSTSAKTIRNPTTGPSSAFDHNGKQKQTTQKNGQQKMTMTIMSGKKISINPAYNEPENYSFN